MTGNESMGGDCVQEADPVRGIRGAHGEHKTAKVRDVRRTCGESGLRGGAAKIVDEVSPGRPQSFRYQRRPVRGGMVQDGGTRGGPFYGVTDRCRENPRVGLRHAVVCTNIAGRANERIAQSKRAHAGSLAIVY